MARGSVREAMGCIAGKAQENRLAAVVPEVTASTSPNEAAFRAALRADMEPHLPNLTPDQIGKLVDFVREQEINSLGKSFASFC